MTNRLILVEGIPGSGKTTTSKKIKDYLVGKGVSAELYNEGDIHPADMAWTSFLTRDEYNKIIQENKKYENVLKENSIFEEGYVIVAYTKLGLNEDGKELMKKLESHEIYNGRVSLDSFKEIHLKRWKDFGEKMKNDEDKIIIFECALLQNHVNELLAVHEKDLEYIKEYLKKLIKTVNNLNPKLIYLKQSCIKETIYRAAKERVSNNKEVFPDWIDMVIEYFSNSNYGKHSNISGLDGVIKYFEKRQEIELEVIKDLEMEKLIIDNIDYDYEYIINEIIKSL